jgi:hypothetical protein
MKKCYGPLHKGEEIDEGLFALNQPVCKACKRKYDQDRWARKRETLNEQCRVYKRNNRPKQNLYKKHVFLAKLQNRLWVRAKDRIRNATQHLTLHFNSYEEVLGCNSETLVTYLRFLYKPGMTDDNFGDRFSNWQMDHIKPIASFDLSTKEGQFAAFNYQNLQPLWTQENKKKGDNLDWKNADTH